MKAAGGCRRRVSSRMNPDPLQVSHHHSDEMLLTLRLLILLRRDWRPSLSVSSLTDKALGRSCLLANTSKTASFNSSSFNCRGETDHQLQDRGYRILLYKRKGVSSDPQILAAVTFKTLHDFIRSKMEEMVSPIAARGVWSVEEEAQMTAAATRREFCLIRLRDSPSATSGPTWNPDVTALNQLYRHATTSAITTFVSASCFICFQVVLFIQYGV
ncbi:hypothetical protein EYF80_056754 [Liparis tanakae]|uniref:Uncharacterized protein n=1 Tax=Liparis tanakae TaxID=230148 RepID=A0A4Z2EXW1_9TELE|nr:hypothetical protein EYF80_056754 [Liparis tanakae]